MKRIFTLFSCLALVSTASLADTGQTVTIDGTVVSKFVTTLTFSGDNVIMTFDDNSSQTADMSLVSIDLTYGTEDTPTAISELTANEKKATGVYTISGLYAGQTTDGLPAGLYIVNGKKVIVK